MNHIYRTLWSVATQSWQAVPETAKTAGKKSKSAASGVIASVALSFSLTGGANAQAPPAINQLPTGGSVVRGTATIQQTATAQAAAMTVNQTSQRAVVNWNTFNIGGAASVNFVQPNAQAVTLNRVNDSNPSQIFGRMTSNGQVVLTNANGIYFAPGSSVDVGAITATTHSITDDNFMSGKYVFERNGATGKIINEGNITAALAGYVAMLAPEVQNAGVVVARAGTVAMAAGETITLNIDGAGSLAGITTTPSAIATLIENKHAVQAPDGQIILSAVALNKLQAGVIKNSGSLEANSLVSKGGKIYLEGDDITLSSTSKLEAKGATGGGTVLVGGDWQGSGEMRQATKVTMEAGATIDASATDKGDGGKVVLWSDIHNAESVTQVEGRIDAKAAANGNGGQVETSGHQLKIGDSATVDTAGGQWLLDPYDFTVASSGGNITGTNLSSLLANNSIIITASGTASTSDDATHKYGSTGTLGDIYINDNVTWGANGTLANGKLLTLTAANNVYVNAPMNPWGNAKLTVTTGVSGNLLMGLNNAPASSGGGFYGSINFTTTQGGTTGRTGTGILTINNNDYQLISTVGTSTDAVRTASLQGAGNTGYVALATDIDATATSTWNLISGTTYAGFNPLTNSGSSSLNGLGHVIKGLYINPASTVTKVGLYGAAPITGIINLGIDDTSSVNSLAVNSATGTPYNANGGAFSSYTGAFAGVGSGIYNSYSQANVTAVSGAVGGIFGAFTSGKLNNVGSYGSVVVTVSDRTGTVMAGGVLGGNTGSAATTISDSKSNANVTINQTSPGGSGATQSLYAGGFIGYASVYNIGTNLVSFNNNLSSGAVQITGASSANTANANQSYGGIAGGFAGYIDGNGRGQNFSFVSNSARGVVSASKGIVGGFAGVVCVTFDNTSQIVIDQSYSTGNVSTTESDVNNISGGFLGLLNINRGRIFITNNYSTGNATDSGGRSGVFIGNKTDSNPIIVTVQYNYANGSASGGSTNITTLPTFRSLGSLTISQNYFGSTNPVNNLNNLNLSGGGYWGQDVNINNNFPFLINNPPDAFTPTFSVKTSGIWGGLTASVSNPVLYGSGISGDTIKIFDGNTSLSPVTVTSGNWAYQSSSDISFGQHLYKVQQVSSVSATYGSKYSLVSTYYLLPTLYVLANTGQSMTYGGALPAITYTFTSDVAGTTTVSGISTSGSAQFSFGGSVSPTNAGDYSLSYLSGLTSSSYSFAPATATRNFTINKANLTVTPTVGLAKTYGGTDPSLTYTTSALVGGDSSIAGLTGSLSRGAGENAGSYSYATTGLSSTNYTFSLAGGASSFTINKANLTVTPTVGQAKTYGDLDPTLTYTTPTLLNADSSIAGLTGSLSRGAGENAGSYSYSTTGLSSTNYTFSLVGSPSSFVINQRPITLAADLLNKTYGAADPALTASITAGSKAPSDSLADVTGILSRSAGEIVGSYDVALGAGAKAANYAITFASNNQAFTINKANLTVTPTVGLAKTYGDTDPSLTYTTSALVGGDSSIAGLTGTLSRTTGENAGIYTYATTGLSSTSYTFTLAGGASSFTINKANLTKVTASKVYDGLTTVTASQITAIEGVNGETFTASTGTASISDKNVVTANKTLTDLSSLTLLGGSSSTLGSNYNLSSNLPVTGSNNQVTITAKALGLSIPGATRVYDGTTTITPTGAVTLTGVETGDQVNMAGGGSVTGYVDKNVGNSKTVTYASLSLAGTDSQNYSLPVNPTSNANITPATLNISGITATDKTYDAGTTATVNTSNVVKTGLIGNDVVNVAATGSFIDKNAGTGKTVNLSSSYSGTDAGNYSITDQTTTTADINKAPLTVTAANAVKNLGDANPALTVALTGFVGGETLATSGVTGTGLATTMATVNTDAGTAAITAAVGTLAASNYTFTNLVDGTLTIRPISALNNNEVSTLIGAQLANLSGTQVGSFSASQLQVFSPQQLSALSPSQLAGMTTLQLLSLSPAQIAAISPAKIALMTPAELGAFTDAQLQALSPTQLAAIAPANFAAFTPAQIMAMSIAQVQNLSPEQLATFTPAQIASLNAAEIAYFDARQLAAIGIFPKVETPVADNTKATQEVAAASTNTKDSPSKFEAPIPVMTEVATANTPAVATPEPLQAATPLQSAALSPHAVQALLFPPNAESSTRTGVLAITILNSAQAKPTTAGIAFEQDADTISLRYTSAPSVRPISDKVVFSDKLNTFMVATPAGEMVEFEGNLVNNRMVIVAPSVAAKRVARTEMNLVLAAAVTSLGKERRVMLANLTGVLLDLR